MTPNQIAHLGVAAGCLLLVFGKSRRVEMYGLALAMLCWLFLFLGGCDQ